MSNIAQPRLSGLPDVIRGRVVWPDAAEFGQSRSAWNLAVEQDPLAVVHAADAADIAALVRYAHTEGLAVATQPSGHGATGRATGAILLRTRELNSIDIDPVRRIATIGSGVQAGELQCAAAQFDLTALPGSSPVVSVAGACLGGGLSWFSRAFGWMADSVLAFDVVHADGSRSRACPTSNADLYWALKGGGGELAIVTALHVQLHSAPKVFAGRQVWPATQARDVVGAYRSIVSAAPDELTVWLELLQFPGAEPAVALDSSFLGDETVGRALMRDTDALPPPLSDSRGPLSVADMGTVTAEPTTPGAGMSRAELLTQSGESAIAELIDQPITPLMTVQIRHLQGALAQPSDSPHGPLAEPFAVYMFGLPSTPERAEQIDRRQRELAAHLPTTGRKPVTFLNPSESLADALPETSIRRLRRLKQQLDPAGTLRGNFAIPTHARSE